jgi:protein-S-isoprenylcysteine O-methyltransferase Ste14
LLLALVAMAALHLLVPIARIVPREAFWGGAAVALLGIALAHSAMREMLRAGTCTEFSGRPSALVSRGSFRLSRNPMYLGMVLLLAGEGAMLGSLGALLPLPVFLLAMHCWYVPAEERRLQALFGTAWDDYRGHVRRWL